METLIRIMANGRTYDEQTTLLEHLNDLLELSGLLLACSVVLGAMAIV